MTEVVNKTEEKRWWWWEERKLSESKDRKEEEWKGGKSILERWLLQARTPASQDQTWRPQRERPAGTATGGGCQGLASGGSSEGSLQQSRPWPVLVAFHPHFLAVVSFCLLVTHHCISSSQILPITYNTYVLSAGPIQIQILLSKVWYWEWKNISPQRLCKNVSLIHIPSE